MKKTLSLLLVNVFVLLGLFTTFGILGLRCEEDKGQERFTGELERNITLRILENDTAKEKGFVARYSSATSTSSSAPSMTTPNP